MRKKIIAGNWKMNKTQSEAIDLINGLKASINSKAEVVFCVPYVCLSKAYELLKDSNISLGAQDMFYEEAGAYTGEISAAMLKDIGVKYVIIGHSERRAYFGETDITVNKKVIKALEKSLVPIVCVGETLTEREQGITIDLVRQQVKVALYNVSAEQAGELVIAYEPVWAIGTGRTATTEQAQEVCAAIRQVIAEIYCKATAESIRIQYGGSVNLGNAAELFDMPDIDGGLVGGASIKDEFADLVNCIK